MASGAEGVCIGKNDGDLIFILRFINWFRFGLGMDLVRKKLMLVGAIHDLHSLNFDSLHLFRKAYLYRRQFDYLAEAGSEADETGLVAALTRALSLSIGFEMGNIYADSGRGLGSIPEPYLSSLSLPDTFTQDLGVAVYYLSPYTIKYFFETLDWVKLDYSDQEKLQWAVSESLRNYARVATIGIDVLSLDNNFAYRPLVARKGEELNTSQPKTLRSAELVTEKEEILNFKSVKKRRFDLV